MANTSLHSLARIRDSHPLGIVPRVFIETGTLYARTTLLAIKLYPVVETIELSDVLYRAAVSRHRNTGIRFHHGDSRRLLPEILAHYPEPVCAYLDAHWFTEPDVVGLERFPLWDELAALRARSPADTVIVDDVRSFGTALPTPDWLQVTRDQICDALDLERIELAVTAGDQFVVYRNPAADVSLEEEEEDEAA